MAPDPVTPKQLQELITKGKAIYDNSILEINRGGDAVRQLPKLAPHYEISLSLDSILALDNEYEESVSKLGHPVDNYALAVVANPKHIGPERKQPPYQNYIHAKGKSILCMNNYAEDDELFGMPNRLFWSDLMAICFSQTMTTYGGDSECLEAIWRIKILNPVTRGIINTVCSEKQSVELKAGDDGFYALLATDHGKGPARMLASHSGMFGRRFMARVRVFRHKGTPDPSICWILEELQHPEPQLPLPLPNRPMSKKKRSAQEDVIKLFRYLRCDDLIDLDGAMTWP